MGVFDITQSVVNQSAGVIIGNTNIDITSVVTDLDNRLSAMDIGSLLGLWFQSLFVGLTMNILSICIMLVVYGRNSTAFVKLMPWNRSRKEMASPPRSSE